MNTKPNAATDDGLTARKLDLFENIREWLIQGMTIRATDPKGRVLEVLEDGSTFGGLTIDASTADESQPPTPKTVWSFETPATDPMVQCLLLLKQVMTQFDLPQNEREVIAMWFNSVVGGKR